MSDPREQNGGIEAGERQMVCQRTKGEVMHDYMCEAGAFVWLELVTLHAQVISIIALNLIW